MRFKSYLLLIFCSFIMGVSVQATAAEKKGSAEREEDLKVIIEQTFLNEDRFDKVASMSAAQAIAKSERDLPIDLVVNRLRESIQSEESLKELMDPYSGFSDKEIHQLREIFENKAFLKYMDQSFPIIKSNMQVMDRLLNTIIHEDLKISETSAVESSESSDEENVEDSREISESDDSEILEITEDNFHTEVEESTKPVIIDVYAHWCRPCRDFASTFEAMHKKYHKKCRFAKVNSEEESLLVHFLKVSAYPTIVFIHKGKVISREVGNMPKEAFEEKIKDFLQDLE